MRRLLPSRRPVPPLATPLVWLLGLAVLGAAGLRWAQLEPPQPRQDPLDQPASSAAPVSRHVTRSLAELGVGGPGGPLAQRGLSDFALLFSRIPKAGSELLALLLQRLQAANGFRLLQLQLQRHSRHGVQLPATEQEELVVQVTETLRREALPVAFHGVLYFTNFTTFDRQSPTFLSLLRDPVERAAAGLAHATRTRSRRAARGRRRRSSPQVASAAVDQAAEEHEMLAVLERCLASPSSAECAWAQPQSLFFCGHDSRCRTEKGDWVLRRAQANMEVYFPAVGILEELNATLAVLETRLPLFFAGVRDVYTHQLREPHVNWNRRVSNLRPALRRKVQKRLALEYELYIWAKQRLMTQHLQDSKKEPLPGEAGQDRLAHSVYKRAQDVASEEA